jgi:D-glycero-D-manno-heptose 1,7-bisphosphate phosphatase
MHRKVLASLEEADRWVKQQRALGRRLGFTCGAFDLFHAGHAHYLQQASEHCDELLVAVNTDESIRRYKSPLRPVVPLAARMEVLAALSCIAAVTPMEDDRPLALIERWHPDAYIKGGDYAAGKLRSADAVAAFGGRTLVIPVEHHTSTSQLIERIRTLDLHAAPQAANAASRKAVLFDRDGTLIENVPFLHDPARIVWRPGVVEALQRLQAAGFRLAIITNQQGLGLGYFNMDQLIAVHQQMLRHLGKAGVGIEKIYFCPHSLSMQCDCRKPKPGMLLRALREMDLDPLQTHYIGDTADDMAAAAAAGITGGNAGEQGHSINQLVEDLLR